MARLRWLKKNPRSPLPAGRAARGWTLLQVASLGASLCMACGSTQPAARATTVQIQPASATTAEGKPPAAGKADAPPAAGTRPAVPAGYIEMEAINITPTPEGLAVVLSDTKDHSVVVPIFIGGTEALSIELRMRHEKPKRPLTHDLFDSMVREVGAELIKVHVDSIQDSVFYGRVFLKYGGRTVDIDARPSDAIALAVGAGAPIFVAKSVLDEAGIYRDASKSPVEPVRALQSH